MRRAAVLAVSLALAPLSGAGWRRNTDRSGGDAGGRAGRSSGSARAPSDSRGRRTGPVPDPTAPWWLNDAPLQNVTGPLPAEADAERSFQLARDGAHFTQAYTVCP